MCGTGLQGLQHLSLQFASSIIHPIAKFLFNQKDAVTPTFVDEKLAVPTECVQAMGLNLTIDDGTATVSYNQKKTAVKLISGGDANYIPVRDVFENLGFNVLWNDNGSVVIYEKELGFDKDVTERYAGKLN